MDWRKAQELSGRIALVTSVCPDMAMDGPIRTSIAGSTCADGARALGTCGPGEKTNVQTFGLSPLHVQTAWKQVLEKGWGGA